ncbi:hypothetical protein RSAG8_05497, partial [Rhizoctonia solani AG-8 WAC10335]
MPTSILQFGSAELSSFRMLAPACLSTPRGRGENIGHPGSRSASIFLSNRESERPRRPDYHISVYSIQVLQYVSTCSFMHAQQICVVWPMFENYSSCFETPALSLAINITRPTQL